MIPPERMTRTERKLARRGFPATAQELAEQRLNAGRNVTADLGRGQNTMLNPPDDGREHRDRARR